MDLVYIVGYITRNANQPSKCKTHFYENYTNLTDCGKLKVHSDHTCQWLFFCFILFHKSLSNIFMLISEFHFFYMEKKYASVFANIVLKYFCKHGTPRSEKEPAFKVSKLS